MNVVQNVHTALRELVLTHKETRAEEPLAVTRQEVGAVFATVLEHAGVFKCTPQGREAFMKFVQSV